jgi:hypothetical protein
MPDPTLAELLAAVRSTRTTLRRLQGHVPTDPAERDIRAGQFDDAYRTHQKAVQALFLAVGRERAERLSLALYREHEGLDAVQAAKRALYRARDLAKARAATTDDMIKEWDHA